MVKNFSFQDFNFIFFLIWNVLNDKLYQLIIKDELKKTYLEQSVHDCTNSRNLNEGKMRNLKLPIFDTLYSL